MPRPKNRKPYAPDDRELKPPQPHWLTTVKWDGKFRIDNLIGLPDERAAIRVDNDAQARSALRALLHAAVKRALKPGCALVEPTVVLIGEQGTRKSLFLEILGGSQYAVASGLDGLEGRDAALLMGSRWIVELPDLVRLPRTKDFLVATHDSFRPPYKRTPIERPRTSVPVITTNVEYAVDTHERRLIPLRLVGPIDVQAVRKIRTEIWAEAAAEVLP